MWVRCSTASQQSIVIPRASGQQLTRLQDTTRISTKKFLRFLGKILGFQVKIFGAVHEAKPWIKGDEKVNAEATIGRDICLISISKPCILGPVQGHLADKLHVYVETIICYVLHEFIDMYVRLDGERLSVSGVLQLI